MRDFHLPSSATGLFNENSRHSGTNDLAVLREDDRVDTTIIRLTALNEIHVTATPLLATACPSLLQDIYSNVNIQLVIEGACLISIISFSAEIKS